MPLQRRLPKFGFKNRFRVEYKAVNVARLQQMVDDGSLDASTPVTPEVLREKGQIGKSDLVKILGSGELTAALQVSANAFSASARKKIEDAGGSVTEL